MLREPADASLTICRRQGGSLGQFASIAVLDVLDLRSEQEPRPGQIFQYSLVLVRRRSVRQAQTLFCILVKLAGVHVPFPPRHFAAAFFEVPQGKHSARKVWPYSATASRKPREEAPLYPCRAPGLLDIRVASTGALIPMGEATRMPELDPDSAKGDLVFELPPPYQNYPRAILLSTASAARSPASQAPPTVPP